MTNKEMSGRTRKKKLPFPYSCMCHLTVSLFLVTLFISLQDVRGWYYLLSDVVGGRKHLRVIDHQVEPQKAPDTCWMDSETVSVISRKKTI